LLGLAQPTAGAVRYSDSIASASPLRSIDTLPTCPANRTCGRR
jgi:hypothetical protein